MRAPQFTVLTPTGVQRMHAVYGQIDARVGMQVIVLSEDSNCYEVEIPNIRRPVYREAEGVYREGWYLSRFCVIKLTVPPDETSTATDVLRELIQLKDCKRFSYFVEADRKRRHANAIMHAKRLLSLNQAQG